MDASRLDVSQSFFVVFLAIKSPPLALLGLSGHCPTNTRWRQTKERRNKRTKRQTNRRTSVCLFLRSFVCRQRVLVGHWSDRPSNASAGCHDRPQRCWPIQTRDVADISCPVKNFTRCWYHGSLVLAISLYTLYASFLFFLFVFQHFSRFSIFLVFVLCKISELQVHGTIFRLHRFDWRFKQLS